MLDRNLWPGDVNRQQRAVVRAGIMLGSLAVELQIAGAQNGAIALVQCALKDQELFVPVVTMPARYHAGGHVADVKPGAQRDTVLQLQNAVPQRVWVNKALEGCCVPLWQTGASAPTKGHSPEMMASRSTMVNSSLPLILGLFSRRF